jgi:hypothetical protein
MAAPPTNAIFCIVARIKQDGLIKSDGFVKKSETDTLAIVD